MKELSKKHILILIILLNLCSNNFIYSQTEDFKPKINKIPTSPEATLFERFGEIPIGYYTGTANISVPLYSINESGVNIPIELNYHSSGIKVADEATWVGLGWSLSPEGMISQEVKGKPDLLDNNLSQSSYPNEYNNFKSHLGPIESGTHYSAFQIGEANKYLCDGMLAPMSSGDSPIIINNLLEGHGQPDIYNYNFYGFSGKFYIHPETGLITFIDKKEDILFEKNGSIGWTATTLDGNIFEFNIIEDSHAGIITDLSGITFKISKIKFNTGKTAYFNYVNEFYISTIRRETAIVKSVGNNDNTLPQFYNDISYNNKKTLSSIEFDDTIIDFNLETREDINLDSNNNVKRLGSIDIKSNLTNKKIKSFIFNYTYFPFNTIGAPRSQNGLIDPYVLTHLDVFGKRLKLDSIKEIGYDDNGVENTTKRPYVFEYDTTITMPLKNSFAVDFFGYFNGQNNDKFLPDLDFFDYQSNPMYKNSITDFGLYFNYLGANRYPDIVKAKAYMLNKVIYPTGGYTTFDYGPNVYTNQLIPDKVKLEAMKRHVEVIDNNLPQNETLKYFTINKNTTIKIENSITPYNVNAIPFTYQQMLPCYILLYKVKMVNGSPIVTNLKEWNLNTVLNIDFETNGGKIWNEEMLIEYDSNPTTKFFIKVYMPDSLNNPQDYYHSSNVKSIVDFYSDEGVDIENNYGCGLRIEEIKSYSQENELSSHKKIHYYEGKLLNKFEPLEAVEAMFSNCVLNNSYHTFSKKVTISSDDFGLNGSNLIGYGRVEVKEKIENQELNGKISFTYFNEMNQTRKGYPCSPFLKNGLIKQQLTYNNSNDLLKEERFNYSNLMQFTSFSGIKINNHIIGTPDIIAFPNVYLYNPIIYYKFSFGVYPINSEWNMLSEKIIEEHYDGNMITTTENYSYNQFGKIHSVMTSNSLNEQISTFYKYAHEIPLDNVISQMLNKNMKGIILETENYNESTLLSKKEIKYGLFDNNFPQPKEIYYGKGGNLEKKIQFDLYDSNGNLLQYTNENDFPVSIIWGYNKTLPIAKIENILYSAIPTVIIDEIENYSTNGDNESLLNILSTLRSSLSNSFVTSFIYKHGVGVIQMTDAKGHGINYYYDDFNRLKKVIDDDGNILSENEYHFRTQN